MGMISLNLADLLGARIQNLEDERAREKSAADSHAGGAPRGTCRRTAKEEPLDSKRD